MIRQLLGMFVQIGNGLGSERNIFLEDTNFGLAPNKSFPDRIDDTVNGHTFTGFEPNWRIEDGQPNGAAGAFTGGIAPFAIVEINSDFGFYPVFFVCATVRHSPDLLNICQDLAGRRRLARGLAISARGKAAHSKCNQGKREWDCAIYEREAGTKSRPFNKRIVMVTRIPSAFLPEH